MQFLLLAALGVFLISLLFFWVSAFRVNVWWGLGVIFVPFLNLAFAIVHWREGGKRFLATIFSAMALGGILGAEVAANPAVKNAFWQGFESGMAKHGSFSGGAPPPQKQLTLHELSNLPEHDDLTLRHVSDPCAAQRAAIVKRAAELNALYTELNKSRAKLKKGSPEVAAFNVKAAKYSEGLAALAAEQAQLAALDHPAAASAALAKTAPGPAADPKETEANAALAQLRVMAAQSDYGAFAETLKKCLADYRQTAAFPQIAATARAILANATPDKLAGTIQAQGTAVATERETAMEKVRLIVNQTPPVAPMPPRSAEIYHYGYHPGALTPDYAHADLYSTRELWKGEYVCMDTVPNVYYRSADCEFNPQTKFFFTSRDLPKKKLTDAEIAEVVRLYRIIATDERLLAAKPQRLHDAQASAADLLALDKQLAVSH